ncbi:unnamed protein product [Protopolystoma xenopodis]|uniref:Uncharacterized protein n=1 Tax=Protopolystoma xenopodis TaxID=117903 RepID=A0A3S5C520_9PLAT|nr:unnamed protein product [Protopolystoma xenopodis]
MIWQEEAECTSESVGAYVHRQTVCTNCLVQCQVSAHTCTHIRSGKCLRARALGTRTDRRTCIRWGGRNEGRPIRIGVSRADRLADPCREGQTSADRQRPPQPTPPFGADADAALPRPALPCPALPRPARLDDSGQSSRQPKSASPRSPARSCRRLLASAMLNSSDAVTVDPHNPLLVRPTLQLPGQPVLNLSRPPAAAAGHQLICVDDIYCTSDSLAMARHFLIAWPGLIISLASLVLNILIMSVLGNRALQSSPGVYLTTGVITDSLRLLILLGVRVFPNLPHNLTGQLEAYQRFAAYLTPLGLPLAQALWLCLGATLICMTYIRAASIWTRGRLQPPPRQKVHWRLPNRSIRSRRLEPGPGDLQTSLSYGVMPKRPRRLKLLALYAIVGLLYSPLLLTFKVVEEADDVPTARVRVTGLLQATVASSAGRENAPPEDRPDQKLTSFYFTQVIHSFFSVARQNYKKPFGLGV